jgi:hypothetical protein
VDGAKAEQVPGRERDGRAGRIDAVGTGRGDGCWLWGGAVHHLIVLLAWPGPMGGMGLAAPYWATPAMCGTLVPAARAVRGPGRKALRLDSGMNAAMGQIYAGYGGDDLEPDGKGPRPRRLDAGFTERPGRLYRPAAGEEFAAIVK